MPSYLVKHYFCVCLWVCFCVWTGGLSKADWRAQSGWTSSNPPKAPAEQKVKSGLNSFSLPIELKHRSSPAVDWGLQHWLSWSSSLWTWPGLTPLTFLPPPECIRQIVGLLSLHKHVSQFLPINLIFYISIHPFHWFCFSREPRLIHHRSTEVKNSS